MSNENSSEINLNTAILIALAAVCAIGLTTLIIFKLSESKDDTAAQLGAEREAKLVELQKGMAEERSSYGVISKEKGTVQLPIDLAMEISLKDLQSQPPRSSGVAVNPAPPAPAAVAEETEETEAAETTEAASAEAPASE